MLKLLLPHIIYFSSVLHAAEGVYYIDTNAIPPDRQIKDLPAASASVKNFNSENSNRGRGSCSMVYISNDGYALTARHCLKGILTNLSAATTIKESGIEVWGIDPEKYKDKDFPITIYETIAFNKPLTAETMEEYFKSSSEKKLKAKIIMTPSGQEQVSNEDLLVDAEIKKKNNWGFFSDYALIKIDAKDTPCSSISHYKKNESVMMIGYASDFPRIPPKIIPSSNPQTISVGHECKMTVSSFEKQLQTLDQIYRKTYQDYYDRYIQNNIEFYNKYSSDFIFHSALQSGGASGGGLFNSDGKLIGINIAHLQVVNDFKHAEDLYAPGSSFAIPVSRIKEELEKANVDVEAAFNCTN